jgi:UDP-2,3-diacylglucosamine pyrophosphatase LpxH
LRISAATAVILGDLHAPHFDPKAFSVACQITAAIGPDAIVLNGDIIDNYQVSSYDRDPRRLTEFDKDLASARECLCDIRNCAHDASIYYTEGNHEKRLTTFKWRNPSVSSLAALTVPHLLDFGSLGIRWVPDQERLFFGGWLVMHGNKVAAKAGNTAHRMMERYGLSGISGHTHRFAQVTRSYYNHQMTWVEGGCLCSLNMEYVDCPDWTHGFVVMHSDGGEVWPELVAIKNGRARYNGVLYTA